MANHTKKTEIAAIEKADKAQIEILDTQISPESLKAITALRTARIPKEDLRQHEGKSGKIFSYVPHPLATATMNDAFGMNWDWQILDYMVYPDKSAVARGQLILYYWDRDGNRQRRTITEVGGYQFVGDNPVLANVVLSACSRALLRCMFRAFGYGKELYKEDSKGLTPAGAWDVLKRFAKTKKVKEGDLVKAIKEAGITDETFIDRYEEAYQLVLQLAAPIPASPDL
jgi:hypothetical protein